MSPDAFDVDFFKSSMKFESHDIDKVDLRLDNLSLVNFPMNMKSENYLEFYLNYLRFYDLSESCRLKYYIRTANCQAKVQKPSCGKALYLPFYKETLSFDSYLNDTILDVPLRAVGSELIACLPRFMVTRNLIKSASFE
jgi:hypothetical protein